MISNLLVVAGLLLSGSVALNAHARTQFGEGRFVEIRPGETLYVEERPTRNGKTLFLENGLTYDTPQWDSFRQDVLDFDPDLGIVAYDMRGMGANLKKDGPPSSPIPLQNQVMDLRALKQALNIKGKTAALGLSYGGAVVLSYASQFPDDFDHYIPVAPFLERLSEQDALVRLRVAWHKSTYLFDRRSDEELYAWYLHRLISTTYPIAEPVLLHNPNAVEGVFQMVMGALNWRASEVGPRLPPRKVHLIAATRDEFVKIDRIQEFLKSVPEGLMSSVLIVNDSMFSVLPASKKYHKITEIHGPLLARWIGHIFDEDPRLLNGRQFSLRPYWGEARSGDMVISLKEHKTGFCDTLLRHVFPTH